MNNMTLFDGQDRKLSLHVALRQGKAESIFEIIKAGANINEYNEHGMTPLMAAVYQGKAVTVEAIIKAGADVNTFDKFGQTPLLEASRKGRLSLIEILINGGANINTPSLRKGRTPLQEAVRSCMIDSVKLLIDAGASIETPDNSGCTPLHEAARYGNADSIKMLISAGAEICVKDNLGNTPLHCVAANWGGINAIGKLIDAGADVNALDNLSQTPLHVAVIQKNLHSAKKLATKDNVNSKDCQGRTALHSAANNDEVEFVKMLIAEGAKIDCLDNEGMTPIHIAAQSGFGKQLKLLIDKGRDANQLNNLGETVLEIAEKYKNLHQAASEDNIDWVQALIAAKANINEKDQTGMTSLHIAAQSGFGKLLKLLIDNGGDANQLNNLGETVLKIAEKYKNLHQAASEDNIDWVQALITAKANINEKDQTGMTPLHIAAQSGFGKLLKLLIDNGGEANQLNNSGKTVLKIAEKYKNLHQAASENNIDWIQALIAAKANINEKDQTGMTPLHIAAQSGFGKLLKLLIDNGGEANQLNNSGKTVLKIAEKYKNLHQAASEDNIDWVQALIAAKANINEKNHEGMTPLHLAAQKKSGKIITSLVKGGAKIQTKNNDGDTALQLAENKENLLKATNKGNLDWIRALIALKVNVNSSDKNGKSPLHIAVEKGSIMAVIALINGGADVKSQTSDGSTPINYAKSTKIKNLLLKAVEKIEASPNETKSL